MLQSVEGMGAKLGEGIGANSIVSSCDEGLVTAAKLFFVYAQVLK